MKQGIKLIIADLIVDKQVFREFFDVDDYFDIFKHLSQIEREHSIAIRSGANAWFNLYEQSAERVFCNKVQESIITGKTKISFFREVHIKGDIDINFRDLSIINQVDVIHEQIIIN